MKNELQKMNYKTDTIKGLIEFLNSLNENMKVNKLNISTSNGIYFITDEQKFNEFELLTLREGLFSIRKNKEIINEEEFKQIDNKIKIIVENL